MSYSKPALMNGAAKDMLSISLEDIYGAGALPSSRKPTRNHYLIFRDYIASIRAASPSFVAKEWRKANPAIKEHFRHLFLILKERGIRKGKHLSDKSRTDENYDQNAVEASILPLDLKRKRSSTSPGLHLEKKLRLSTPSGDGPNTPLMGPDAAASDLGDSLTSNFSPDNVPDTRNASPDTDTLANLTETLGNNSALVSDPSEQEENEDVDEGLPQELNSADLFSDFYLDDASDNSDDWWVIQVQREAEAYRLYNDLLPTPSMNQSSHGTNKPSAEEEYTTQGLMNEYINPDPED